MNFKKYLWKCRLLVLNTPNYSHPEYKRSKELYQKEIKGFHKRYIKLVTKLDKSKKFKVILIGFDGTIKIELDKIYNTNIIGSGKTISLRIEDATTNPTFTLDTALLEFSQEDRQ